MHFEHFLVGIVDAVILLPPLLLKVGSDVNCHNKLVLFALVHQQQVDQVLESQNIIHFEFGVFIEFNHRASHDGLESGCIDFMLGYEGVDGAEDQEFGKH